MEPSPCLHIHTLRQRVFLHRFGSHKKVPERWVNNCVKEEGDTLGSLSPLRPEDEGWDCQWVGWGYGEWAIKITASALGNQGKRICFTLKLALQINLNGFPGRTDFLITTFQPLLLSSLPAPQLGLSSFKRHRELKNEVWGDGEFSWVSPCPSFRYIQLPPKSHGPGASFCPALSQHMTQASRWREWPRENLVSLASKSQ